MSEALDAAFSTFEEATHRVVELVKGASYGLRVGAKRLGDLTAKGGPLASATKKSADEMRELIASLEHADENLSEAAVILLGVHFSTFLRTVLSLEKGPPLPGSPGEIERLIGHPGSLTKISKEFRVFLALYDAMLACGCVNRAALERLGVRELELIHPGGKVKMYMEGERVTLSEEWIETAVKASVDAARIIKFHLSGPVLH